MATKVPYFPPGWVSDHFRQHEFSCPCCGLYHENPRLVFALETLRGELGDHPITVYSGTRCSTWNTAIGGAKKSRHLGGEAADIVVSTVDPAEVARVAGRITEFYHGGIGTYGTFTHLDVRRGGPARWDG